MAKPRRELHKTLCDILGSRNCYFSPPSDKKKKEMKYPCIVYHLSNFGSTFADNVDYLRSNRYTVTVIDMDPDSELPEKVLKLPYCTSDRNYVVDGLNHFAFTLFF